MIILRTHEMTRNCDEDYENFEPSSSNDDVLKDDVEDDVEDDHNEDGMMSW